MKIFSDNLLFRNHQLSIYELYCINSIPTMFSKTKLVLRYRTYTLVDFFTNEFDYGINLKILNAKVVLQLLGSTLW